MRKALYILGSLDDGDIEWIARHASRMALRQGDTLIREGQPIDHLFIVIDGQFSVRIGAGASQEIAVLLSGEIVGEISFVDNRKPTASVIALQDSQVLTLDKQTLQVKLTRDYGFASRFYRAIAIFLADRLFTTTARLGYGGPQQDRQAEVDDIEDSMMDQLSVASIRFDKLLRYLAEDPTVGSFAGVKY
jgi:CRP/FNR family cyclic AMP-dependent transcriptional regulator